MKLILILVILLAPQWLFASLPTTPLAEKINEYCGNNPALAYIKQYNKVVLSVQTLENFDVCSKSVSNHEKQNLESNGGEIQLCLAQKFKYNPNYANKIAPYITEAKRHTLADMEMYTLCVNNIEQCGSSKCDETK